MARVRREITPSAASSRGAAGDGAIQRAILLSQMSKVALRARFNTGLPRVARNDTVPLARAFSGRSRDREGNNRTT